MDIQSWKNAGQYFTYKERHQIFYQFGGNGENLILLHGFPTSSWDWNKIWPELTERFKVFAPDFIGFGYSDKPKKYTYSIHDQADLIENFLADHSIESLHMLAHDYGDSVAQELLARHNEREKTGSNHCRIKSLVLLNGGLFPETHRARPVQKALIGPLGFLVNRLLNKKSLHRSFNRIFGPNTQPTQQEIDEFYSLIVHNGGKNLFYKLIRYMSDRIEHRGRWVKALQETNIPVRLINGSFDPVSGHHMTIRYNELVDDADIVHLENIGHYPQTEAPHQVIEHYLSFIQTIS